MNPSSQTFKAIGTTWHVEVRDGAQGKKSDKEIEDLFVILRLRIEQFENTYSRFRERSLIQTIAKKAGTYELPHDAAPLFELYRKLYDISLGKVTPLVGQVLVDAGYDPAYSLKQKEHVASARKWDDVMQYDQDKNVLVTKEPVQLDLGAFGKGYLIDIVSELILSHGYKNFTVDAGGDMRHQDDTKKSIRVGLEDPDDATKVLGVAEISDTSLCGSSGNRRKWAGYHHIIDPDTATSPRHIRALWTTANTTLHADALATALFFVEPEILLAHFDFEYAIVFDDRTVHASEKFPGHFFMA